MNSVALKWKKKYIKHQCRQCCISEVLNIIHFPFNCFKCDGKINSELHCRKECGINSFQKVRFYLHKTQKSTSEKWKWSYIKRENGKRNIYSKPTATGGKVREKQATWNREREEWGTEEEAKNNFE